MSAAGPQAPSLWRARLWAVARLELRRSLSPRTGLWLYLLVLFPALIISGHALFDRRCRLAEDTNMLASMFQFYYLRVAIFFGCLWLFTRALRGELLERTLHYLLLAPIRRELIVLGKFLGALITSALLFGGGLLLMFALTYLHSGPAGRDFVLQGSGLAHLGAYGLIVLLACIGFGAVFLLLGLLVRNTAIPGLLIFVWETFSGILPTWLQRLTVTYYLKPLLPMELPDEGLNALISVVAEPVSAWVAVGGLVAFGACILAVACWRVRRLEINYTTD